MPNITHVLISDPSGELPEGFVFSNHLQLSRAEARGAVVLPVDDDLVPGFAPTLHPCDGFVIRSWGEGWLLNRNAGERACPMLLRVLPERQHVWWAARIVGDKAGAPLGQLRLTTDSSNPQFASAGLSPAISPPPVESLQIDRQGGYTIRGCSRINVTAEALMALNLYGACRNVRVLWSAVSLCRQGWSRN